MIYLFLILFLTACGKPPAAGDAYQFAAKFDSLAKAHNYYVPTSSYTIDFPDIAPAKERIDCAGKHVSIDAKVWSDIRDGYREAIVFHVLAHCLIKRGHRDGNTTSGTAITEPLSLMNSEFVSGQIYLEDNARYVEELFAQPFQNDTLYP